MDELNRIEWESQPLLKVLGTPKFSQFQKVKFLKTDEDSEEQKVFFVSGIKANFSTYPRYPNSCISKPRWTYYLVNVCGEEQTSPYTDPSIEESELVEANA